MGYDEKDVIVLGLVSTVALVAVGIAAAYEPGYDYAKVCGDDSYVRIDDDRCVRGESGSTVMFISTSSTYDVPAVGNRMDSKHFLRTLPSGKTAQPNFTFPKTSSMKPAGNPNIQRGGFGFGRSSGS